MKIIVGLGNPGKEYEKTRHNYGWRVACQVVSGLGGEFKKSRFRAKTYLHVGYQKVFFVLPLTFMNLSGEAIGRVLGYYKKTPEALLVIYDDLDLPLGRMKFSKTGSSGGHHGLDSIIETLQTKKFDRLRLGIGKPKTMEETVNFVLSSFSAEERKIAEETEKKASEAVQYYVDHGMDLAMNEFNGISCGL